MTPTCPTSIALNVVRDYTFRILLF